MLHLSKESVDELNRAFDEKEYVVIYTKKCKYKALMTDIIFTETGFPGAIIVKIMGNE